MSDRRGTQAESPVERRGHRDGVLACHKLGEYGTIEVGKLADLLVFEADPLAEIGNIRRLIQIR
jgi:cytosine/adenosine deaminase-related metal-dependent hydrolase